MVPGVEICARTVSVRRLPVTARWLKSGVGRDKIEPVDAFS